MKSLATLSLIICTLILSGCEETKRVIDVAGNVQITGNYTVSSINGNKVSTAPNPSFSLSALNNSLRGTSGCNSFFADYDLDMYTISFNNLAVSEKFCDQKMMDTEREFLSALKNTGSFAIENDVLTLYSKKDRSVLMTATKDAKK